MNNINYSKIPGIKLETEKNNSFFQLGTDLNTKDKNGDTNLHLAIKQHLKTNDVEKLIGEGADLNIKNYAGETPLHLAIKEKRFSLVGKLIKKGADLTIENKDGETPISLASKTQNFDLLKDLIVAGANPTLRNSQGELPKGLSTDAEITNYFKSAIKKQDIELVKALVNHYGDKLKETYLNKLSGRTLHSYAKAKGYQEIVIHLEKNGFKKQRTWAEFFAETFYPKTSLKTELSVTVLPSSTPPRAGKSKRNFLNEKNQRKRLPQELLTRNR